MADRNTNITQFVVEVATAGASSVKNTRITQFAVETAIAGSSCLKNTRVTQFSPEILSKLSAQFGSQEKSILLEYLSIADPNEITGTSTLPAWVGFKHLTQLSTLQYQELTDTTYFEVSPVWTIQCEKSQEDSALYLGGDLWKSDEAISVTILLSASFIQTSTLQTK